MAKEHQLQEDSKLVEQLLKLGQRARSAKTAAALQFILVNETFNLVEYQITALWRLDHGIIAHTGVSAVEQNTTYTIWLSKICKNLCEQNSSVIVTPDMISQSEADVWSNMLPAHALWIPIQFRNEIRYGILIARDRNWDQIEIQALNEWIDIWRHAYLLFEKNFQTTLTTQLKHKLTKYGPTPSNVERFIRDFARGIGFIWRYYICNVREWPNIVWNLVKLPLLLIKKLKQTPLKRTAADFNCWAGSLWTSKKRRYALIVGIFVFLPVRLTVLAPAELVPEKPYVVRVPIDGVIDEFFITPNQKVQPGQSLFRLDLTSLLSRLQIAQQELNVASTEHKQTAIQSLTDLKSRSLLISQEGKVSEKKLEADYLKTLVEKAQISSKREGIAIFDDPSSWIGKPVAAGEKIMLIATETDMEIEAWLALNEIIPLKNGSTVSLFLNSAPLHPITGNIRYLGHEPIQRPDGSFAYRLRASIQGQPASARIGFRGTAKISGDFVPLSYWILRKPFATARQFFGL